MLLLAATSGLPGQAPPAAPATAPPAAAADTARFPHYSWFDNRDWAWYAARIPIFDSPDTAIDATYYYRWELVTKHLTYGSPESGYTFSEFIDRPFWSGAFGSISCPLGHQFYEVRWLKDRRIVDDFARYWFDTPGAQPRSYSNWYGDAMWATYLVNGDRSFIARMLPYMERQYDGWVREHFDSTAGMFHWDGMHDGMEFNIDSRQTAQPFDGADGYRPTLNSYLFADERAISRAARLVGDRATAARFAGRAAALKARVQRELWDPRRQFFLEQFAHDEAGGIKAGSRTYETGKYAGNPHGREEIGFVPWQFDLPDSGYEAAWRYVMDTAYFAAPYGPTTTERHDPLFRVSPTCCWWSGNSWPYATTQTLEAMANLLNDYRQSYVTKRDWMSLLQTYTRTQRYDGRPYIAEAANPDDGSWSGHNSYYHSEHYFHSGYVDLVITGVVGLRPRADDSVEVNPLAPDDWPYFALDGVGYHGHDLSIVWDRDGSRYHRGRGLSIIADGRVIANRPTPGRLVARLGAPRAPAHVDRPSNLAVNSGRGAFPWLTASFSAPENPPFYAVDGSRWYAASPPNRWTAVGSPNRRDTLTLDLGETLPVEQLALYFVDDGAGSRVRAPLRYDVAAWTGTRWTMVPRQRRLPAAPTGHRANTVSFPRIATRKLRVIMTHAPGAYSGLTELEAWSHAALPLPRPTAAPHDLAFDPDGDGYPKATASFTGANDRVDEINDLRIAFTRYSRNRWTAYGSPNASDWVQIDFGTPTVVRTLELFFWADGGGVKAPKRYTVQYWTGSAWADARVRSRIPVVPLAPAMNTVRIDPVRTSRVRVVLEHDRPAVSGLTELIIPDDQP